MQLLSIARRLLLWAHTHFLSVRAVYIPGVLNTGADIMSRGGPRHGDWSLHPELVNQIRNRFGKAKAQDASLRFSTGPSDTTVLGSGAGGTAVSHPHSSGAHGCVMVSMSATADLRSGKFCGAGTLSLRQRERSGTTP